ncbi:D-glycerate dehydrogenase [Marivita sp.]|uniref:2-hydroxyacid dehydrogenase n=1 Tax=Marivita sp. TaxID=2003365 RepID=UPI0025C2CC8E|nr:D-glycerate dehydrogenase [Marivita sp.]
MKLLITRPLPDTVIAQARAHFDTTMRDQTTPMDRAELVQSLSDYDIVLPTLGDLYSADVFDAVPNPRARLLANFGVGYNHIDAAAAKSIGIAVTNTPGAVTDATADIAMTLMLMTCRRAGEGERLVRAGQWQGWHPTQLLGLHLTGKTLGIVGMGRIGQAIAQRAHHGFGMTLKYYNRSSKPLPFPAEQVASLADLAAQVDVLVIAVPGGAETHHMIDASVLSNMKPHARLVNIARGDVIKEDDLIAALEKGAIAGAGLDVYEHEPDVPQALIGMETVTLLPHLGTAALEVREAMGLMAIDNALAFAKGATLPNPV